MKLFLKMKNQNGFTLIELMVAMVILAFSILSYSMLNMRSLNNRVFAREMTFASQLAARTAEILMYRKYDDPLLADDNTENPAVASKYPPVTVSNGTTGTFAGAGYTVVSITSAFPQGTSRTDKWYMFQPGGRQRYYLRWEVTAGNSAVSNSPDDKVKLIKIFTAFEKRDPQTGKITLGGYNPSRIGPTVITFNTDIES